MVIMAILLSLGIRTYQDWNIRTKIRVSAESLASGLTSARNSALQRNDRVIFSLTTNLTAACALGGTTGTWVISLDSPEGQCNAPPSDVNVPRILEVRSREEGSGVVIAATNSGGGAANQITFTGLGRVLVAGANPISAIDVNFDPASGTCISNGGNIRCLRVRIGAGGETRICDPAVADPNDPRTC